MDLFFNAFLKARTQDFRRIAHSTVGEMTPEDLHSEAWLMAWKLGERQNRKIDFSDLADQELILAALYVEHVRRADWTQRRALSLDKEPDEDDWEAPLMERLVASKTSDPLVFFEWQETMQAQEEAEARSLAASYSQAAAYFIFIGHFDGNRKLISAYLVIHRSTLYLRIKRASSSFHAQPSLFDRVESVPDDFMPLPGREWARSTGLEPTAQQAAWAWF
jgi:hypothetical protein